MKNYWKAFGSLFFLLHQGKLLWLLNAPVVGRWFRWVLRISGDSSAVGKAQVTRILPNAIFWWNGDKQVAEFRTHAKFSKRLYYAFAPLWWALHAWDWCVADRWVPELSFGFSTLTAYPDDTPSTSCDGYVSRTGVDETWGTVRAGAGNYSLYTGEAAPVACHSIGASATANQWSRIRDGVFLFDTSALPAGASVSAATMSLYGGASKSNDLTGSSPTYNVYSANPASNIALANSDYGTLGATAYCNSAISYASWSDSAYNDFALNATGIAAVVDGISKFGFREATYEVANSAPPWTTGAFTQVKCYFANQTGTANDPKLVVTYTLIGQVIMISQKPMGLKDIALMTVVGLIIKNPSISRKKLLRWWHEDN